MLVAHTSTAVHGCEQIGAMRIEDRERHLGLDDGNKWWVLHVRRLQGPHLRILVAFIVDLAYALGRIVTIDHDAGPSEALLKRMSDPAGTNYQHPFWQPGMYPWPYLYKVAPSAAYRASAAVYVIYPTPADPEPTVHKPARGPRRAYQPETVSAPLLAAEVRAEPARQREEEETQPPPKRRRFECVACARLLETFYVDARRHHPVVCDSDCLEAFVAECDAD